LPFLLFPAALYFRIPSLAHVASLAHVDQTAFFFLAAIAVFAVTRKKATVVTDIGVMLILLPIFLVRASEGWSMYYEFITFPIGMVLIVSRRATTSSLGPRTTPLSPRQRRISSFLGSAVVVFSALPIVVFSVLPYVFGPKFLTDMPTHILNAVLNFSWPVAIILFVVRRRFLKPPVGADVAIPSSHLCVHDETHGASFCSKCGASLSTPDGTDS
jgi:hypothetical protein